MEKGGTAARIIALMIELGGVLAPKIICSYYNKHNSKYSKIFQILLTNFGVEHIQIYYIHAKFCDEKMCVVLCAKKKSAPKIYFRSHFGR